MSNQKFKLALQKSIDNFKKEYLGFSREQFTTVGDLIHPGEFGKAREKICKELLKKTCAAHISIDDGFVINDKGGVSKQQDLIFYDKYNTPILNVDEGKFFPVETIVCVGQIKSIIQSKKDLKEALLSLMEVKKMREQITNPGVLKSEKKTYNGIVTYEPITFMYDQVFTFLVCEKFAFEITAEEVDALYPQNTPTRYKHNNILNLESGIYQYTSDGLAFPYPEAPLNKNINGGMVTPRFNKDSDGYNHILHLMQNISLATKGTTILNVELGDYY